MSTKPTEKLNITKIQDLYFSDDKNKFVWDEDTKDFIQHSVIYGGNGSGKSTIAAMLNDIDKYGKKNLCLNGPISQDNIKVFTKEYMNNNLYLNKSNNQDDKGIELKPIHQVSFSKEAKEANTKLDLINEKLEEYTKSKEENKTRIQNFLTDLARSIKARMRESGINSHSELKSNTLEPKIIQWDKELAELKERYNAENIKTEISDIEKFFESPNKDKVAIIEKTVGSLENKRNNLNNIIKDTNLILNKVDVSPSEVDKVISNTIFNNWVKEGYDIHSKHPNDGKCIFCTNELPGNRMDKLKKYFEQSFDDHKKEIEEQLTKIKQDKINIPVLGENDPGNKLFEDSSKEYNEKVFQLREDVNAYNKILETLYDLLEKKKKSMMERLEFSGEVPPLKLEERVEAVDEIAKKHNDDVDKIDDIKKEKEEKALKLMILENNNYTTYKELDGHRGELADNISEKTNEKNQSLEVIKKYDVCVSEINKRMEKCFGHSNISFAPSDTIEGRYTILRDNLPAENLSEGEKNIIALIYFSYTLDDKSLKKNQLCVVFDDPITCFDTENFYYAIELIAQMIIKSSVNQSIILTHNLNLIDRIWYRWPAGGHTKFFHINSKQESKELRTFTMKEMDEKWLEGISDYNFVFQQVYSYHQHYTKTGTLSNEQKKELINPLRRLLEAVTDFCFPNITKFEDRIEKFLFDNNETILNKMAEELDANTLLNILHAGSHCKSPIKKYRKGDEYYDKIPDALVLTMDTIKKYLSLHDKGMREWSNSYFKDHKSNSGPNKNKQATEKSSNNIIEHDVSVTNEVNGRESKEDYQLEVNDKELNDDRNNGNGSIDEGSEIDKEVVDTETSYTPPQKQSPDDVNSNEKVLDKSDQLRLDLSNDNKSKPLH